MTKCNGDCGSCSSKEGKKSTTNSSFPFRKDVDVSSFLKPIPKPEKDNTPLDYPCKCEWEGRNTKRYMCLPCIKTWVEAVSFEVAMGEVDRLEKKGKRVAADRVRECARDKKWKGKIDADCRSDAGCGDCCCNSTGEDLPST